jgi:hypothetical protein
MDRKLKNGISAYHPDLYGRIGVSGGGMIPKSRPIQTPRTHIIENIIPFDLLQQYDIRTASADDRTEPFQPTVIRRMVPRTDPRIILMILTAVIFAVKQILNIPCDDGDRSIPGIPIAGESTAY